MKYPGHKPLLFLTLILLGLGCNSAVEPDPAVAPATGFVFTPASDHVSVTVDELFVFKITHHPDPDFNARWQLNGHDAGIGPRYGFIPQTTGRDTLTATADWRGHTQQRRWVIETVTDTATTVAFAPAPYSFELTSGDTIRFDVISSRPDLTDYYWQINGQTVSEAASYLYTAASAGLDTLRTTAVTPRYVEGKTWVIHTYAPGQLRPLPPREPVVGMERQTGWLNISWLAPENRGDPIVTYAVAISYTGPINDSDWHQADVLTEVPALAGVESYHTALPADHPGLVPGAHAWLAVASLNSYGMMCAAPPNREVDIIEFWWIEGAVSDDSGRPLPNILVRAANLEPTALTGPDGKYRIGPFSNTSAVTLQTETPDAGLPGTTEAAWYDMFAETLFIGGAEHWDFQLISRTPLAASCRAYDGEFLAYLRSMTTTIWPTSSRPNLHLYKWDSYPVPVWVPEFTNAAGDDVGALCRQTVTWWNEAMGDEYLTLVADQAAARIVFRFGGDQPGFFGKTTVLAPYDQDYALGEVIPELIEVYLLDELEPPQMMQEIALHELGHALGLSAHAACSDADYLMYIVPSGRLDNGPEQAIHRDEKRALKAIRHLSQGFDMGRFVPDSSR